MIFQVESFQCPDKQGTPKEGWRIQWPKRYVTTNNNKDEDDNPKINTQIKAFTENDTYCICISIL